MSHGLSELILLDGCRLGKEAITAVFMHLKLNDSVLIHFNVPGGDGVLSKLTGDKHHG